MSNAICCCNCFYLVRGKTGLSACSLFLHLIESLQTPHLCPHHRLADSGARAVREHGDARSASACAPEPTALYVLVTRKENDINVAGRG